MAEMSAVAEAKRGRKAGTIYFPRHSLRDVLPIAKSIWEQNAGNPFDILDVAQAVDQSPTSGRFIQRLASSYRYGLTEGSPTTKLISLTPLGSSIAAPTADIDVNAQLRTALLNPPIFQKVYTWMDRKPIPRDDVLRNTLMKPPELGGFGIPKEDVDEFVRVFVENIEDYGLAKDVQGTKYLRLDKLAPEIIQAVERPLDAETVPALESGPEEIRITSAGQSPAKIATSIPKQIFVAHGKNRKPVEQLERILQRFRVPHKIAVEEPHSGRPVSDKLADLMRECTSGIFVFTADEETTDAKGQTVWRPSDNVVYELGAASLLYGKKIVIFKEEGVDFASDFGDLGYIPFEKDKLEAKAADLMLELITLGFVQLTPT